MLNPESTIQNSHTVTRRQKNEKIVSSILFIILESNAAPCQRYKVKNGNENIIVQYGWKQQNILSSIVICPDLKTDDHFFVYAGQEITIILEIDGLMTK